MLRLGPPHRLGYWDPWLWSDTRGRPVEAARGWSRGCCSGHRRPCPLGINERLLVDTKSNIKSMLIYKASVIRPISINRRTFLFRQKNQGWPRLMLWLRVSSKLAVSIKTNIKSLGRKKGQTKHIWIHYDKAKSFWITELLSITKHTCWRNHFRIKLVCL